MTQEKLKKLFARFTEDAQFETWNAGKTPGVRFVYACEYGTIWKFTPKAWWQSITKAIRNQGSHDFTLSTALCRRPRHIYKGSDKQFHSSDQEMRCVNPADWTVEDWTNELMRP
jgi:hypothetical protein